MGPWLGCHWLFCFHRRLGIHPNRGTARISAILRQWDSNHVLLETTLERGQLPLEYSSGIYYIFYTYILEFILKVLPTIFSDLPSIEGLMQTKVSGQSIQTSELKFTPYWFTDKLSLQTVQAEDTIMQQSIQPSYYVIIKVVLWIIQERCMTSFSPSISSATLLPPTLVLFHSIYRMLLLVEVWTVSRMSFCSASLSYYGLGSNSLVFRWCLAKGLNQIREPLCSRYHRCCLNVPPMILYLMFLAFPTVSQDIHLEHWVLGPWPFASRIQ